MVTLPKFSWQPQIRPELPEFPKLASGAFAVNGGLQALIEEAKARFIAGDYMGAERHFRRVYNIARSVNDKRLQAISSLAIGAALRNTGQLLKSLDYFTKAAEINPGLHQAHAYSGLVLMQLERWALAVDAFDKVLEIVPHDAMSQSAKGIALINLERYAEAVPALQKSIELGDHDPLVLLSYGYVLIRSGEYDRAIESFEEAFALRRHLALMHVAHARELYRFYALALLARGVEVTSKGDLDRGQELMARLRRLQIQGRIEGKAKAVREAMNSFKASYPEHREKVKVLVAMLEDPWVGWKAASYIIGEHWPKGLSVAKAVREARE